MAWEWQVWRCFDDVREIFEEKGWKSGLVERNDNGVMPLSAESGDYCVAFFKRDPSTGQCWFELRDRIRHRMVFVQGTHNIPTPERAAKLLANYGGPSYDVTTPLDRPIYGLPIVPVMAAADNG